MSRPGIEPVTSRSPERTLYQLSYRGRSDRRVVVSIKVNSAINVVITARKSLWYHMHFCTRSALFALTHISLASSFLGYRQTVQTQIRRRRTRRLIRVHTVCLQEFLFQIEYKWNCKPDTPKIWNGLVIFIWMGCSTRQMWVNPLV